MVFEIGSKCVNATYTLNADGTVGVWNQAINLFGKYSTIRGTASVKNSVEPGALEVVFDKPGKSSLRTTLGSECLRLLYFDVEQAKRVIIMSFVPITTIIPWFTLAKTFQ